MTMATDATIGMESKLGAAAISDALRKVERGGGLYGIRPVWSRARVIGPAFTVQCREVSAPSPTGAIDFLDEVPPGAVIVMDALDIVDATFWGSIVTRVAELRGVAGAVTNGACRDTDYIESVRFPLFAAAIYMRTGRDRIEVEAVNKPIRVAGVTIEPGDMIIADNDGVVAVAGDAWDAVAQRAQSVLDAENAIMESVARGGSLREARAQYHYLSLHRND